MADTISRGSMDSLSTGDEFVVVNAEPRLKISGNGGMDDLEKNMSEVLSDESQADSAKEPSVATVAEHLDQVHVSNERALSPAKKKGPAQKHLKELPVNEKLHKVGESKFYGVQDHPLRNDGDASSAAVTSPTSPVPEEDSVYAGITYLGSASVNAPRSMAEINRNMSILNEQSQCAIPILLTVPNKSEGIVRLVDPENQTEISSYRIHSILFCAAGAALSDEKHCFAFTFGHGNSCETAIYQCHVFRCDALEIVQRILKNFLTAFGTVPNSPSTISESGSVAEDSKFLFSVTLEFLEDDLKGNYSPCPKDNNVFKLRCNLEKKIVITVHQVSMNRELKIERCFGLLISAGRNVQHSDMHLIDMVSMGSEADGHSYIISGLWDPTQPSFMILNTETPKDRPVFMTIAVDLVIENIQEPVRFLIETKAKIFPMNERFWYFVKKPLQEQFVLQIRECEPGQNGQAQYEVVNIENQTELERKKPGMARFLFPSSMPAAPEIQTPQEEEESDGDEPLLSGSGVVSKDVTDQVLMDNWAEALDKWRANLKSRPKQISTLVRKGIPEALRGEVWQLLSGCHDNNEMMETYRILIAKDSPNEQVILRDINRTFPAHDYFRETGGVGQDTLYKISKAYSVYDEEVGYCQGLSFLAASLLLHMPEEEAFCVLVKIMFDYNLRDLFKPGFEELHLKFYQLERLMEDQLPDLCDHFMDMGLNAHMFASQWFLTLFTAKFPLHTVFHILDLFLCDGKDTIFSMAMALLKISRKDLLALDFEGVLKYFRVQLPKRYRSEENAKELMHTAVKFKISNKKLKKYEKEYIVMKQQEMEQEDPLERLKQDNDRLTKENMRLEQENDDLAHELMSSKIALRQDLDTAEDQCETLKVELLNANSMLSDTQEEKARLEIEASQLKEMCRRELDRAESEGTRNNVIIQDYKQICSQLSGRLEKQQASFKEEIGRIKAQIASCANCNQLVSPDGEFKKINLALTEGELAPALADRDRQIRELELELAQTKLALVESECQTQDLTHQLNAALNEVSAAKNTWFQKTLTSIRDVTTKKDAKDEVKDKEVH